MKYFIIAFTFLLEAALTGCASSTSSENECSKTSYPEANTSEYVLPFPVGKTYKLKQSNCGSFTHTGKLAFAYDFFMDEGEMVTASRGGEVVFIFNDGPDGPGDHSNANFIVIKHDDNTIGRYRHLKQDGILLQLGDVVATGQEIALSGNSGVPSGIGTLHFDVMKPNNDNSYNQTIPFTFKNSDPPGPTATGLDEGVSYTALSY